MKIIIPVLNFEREDARIADSFHNTEFACVYCSFSNTYEWIATKNLIKEGNLGLVLRQKNIDAVISRNMPLMALSFFVECGLSVYQAKNNNIKDNIEWCAQNQLQKLTSQTALFSSCSGACNSCQTTCKS